MGKKWEERPDRPTFPGATKILHDTARNEQNERPAEEPLTHMIQ
jgi:hypothetical protein